MYQVTEIGKDTYERLAPGIKSILAKCPDAAFTAKTLFDELVIGQTRLFVDDTSPNDFVIVRLDWNPRQQIIEMFIRAAYSDHPKASSDYEKKLIMLARYFKAERITMISSRPGFKRRSKWVPQSVLYSMEID